MLNIRVRYPTALVVCFLGGSAGVARAQSTAQIPLQFDYLNPGARSLALGSAFVAVADDATAAFTNPAGLTYLVKPEVSAEIRYRRLQTPFLSGGRLSGTVTNTGPDTISGPVYGLNIDSAARPYFLSFVYPGRRWAVSLYRHELVRQDNSFASTGEFEALTLANGSTATARELALSGSRSIRIDNYGAAAAYRFNGTVAAGIGAVFSHFNLVSDFARYHFQVNTFGPVDYSQPTAVATQRGSGTSAAVNAGVILTASSYLRFGAVYRQGSRFDFTQDDAIVGTPELIRRGEFRTPHVVAVGARIQPRDNVSLSVDYDRVLYSRLKQDFIDFQAVSTGTQSQLEVADGNEVHAGVEYVFVNISHTPAVRAGVWYDPDHAVRYLSDGSNSQVDVRLKATLPGGDNLVHYCLGFGVPLSAAFEFNAAGDFTSKRKYASASLVARFGK